ncbi:MAG TPA: DUF3054 domain-containing protein [Dehalococcoidia bacterium]|nr:DUF3054 domain-containing protein [Dehalococcoidia bacterium]
MDGGEEHRLSLLLPLGDLAVFAVFLLAGASGHEDGLSASTVGRSFLPFVAVWFVVGPPLGAFRPPISDRLSAIWRLLPIWLLCGLLALALRSAVFERDFWSGFTVVALVFNGVLLLAWRLVYLLALRRLAR